VAVLEEERATAPAAETPSPAGPRPVTAAARRTLDALRARQVRVDFTDANALQVMKVFLDLADVQRAISAPAAATSTAVTLVLDGSTAHAGLDGALFAVAVVLGIGATGTADAPVAVPKWEYMVDGKAGPNGKERMNAFGKDGWELVAVDDSWYWKRPVP
jgi:hypothetical protein